MNEQKRNLPAIQDLYEEKEIEVLKKENVLNILLNQPPKPTWVKDHPMARGVKYLPIERVEWLLTSIFISWRVEVRTVQLIGNSIVVTVRLYYRSIVDGEETWHDGIGAAPLQTDKGAGAIEFDKLKNDAVMKAAPAAESYAVKDAAEKIGKLFGKDLNRADQIMYDLFVAIFAKDTDKENLDAMQKVIAQLDKYQGKDKAAIKQECLEYSRNNSFTTEFAENVMKRIGGTL